MTETAAAEEPNEQTEDPQKNEALASKHGFIDFDKIEDAETRQQVQDRLNGLYHSNKDNAHALAEMQRLYGGMQKEMAELKAAKAKESADAKVADVKKGIADANAKGEYERAADLTEELGKLTAPKPAPQPKEEGGLTPAQESALFAWQAEMTDDGRIKRPWANPSHPKYRDTIAELTKAYNDPSIASQGFGNVLDAVHERMAPKPKQTSPVVDGDATPPRQSTKSVKLTPQQERTARRMYPPSVLEKLGEKDPLVAYSKALKKYGE